MYTPLLFIHSWIRWAIVVALVLCVVQSLRGADIKRLRTIAVATFDTQVLLGILLYVVGPMTPRSREAFSAYMKAAPLRFFTVEHPFAMVIALGVLHIFSARSRKATTEEAARRALLIGSAIALILVLLGIPWPGSPYARPLFRLP